MKWLINDPVSSLIGISIRPTECINCREKERDSMGRRLPAEKHYWRLCLFPCAQCTAK